MKAVQLAYAVLLIFSVEFSHAFNMEPLISKLKDIPKAWTSGHNKYFDGMSIDEIRSLMGTIEAREDQKLPIKEVDPTVELPDSFDSR